MGKTFRRNEGRRPKWDKHGKSRKLREFEEDKFKHHSHSRPSVSLPQEPSDPIEEPTDY